MVLNIDVYNDAISRTWSYLLLNMIPLIIVAIVLVVIALIGLFKQLIKKYIICLLLILSVIVLTYAIAEMCIFNYDIQHENFVVYYGEFDYRQVSGSNTDVFKSTDNSYLHVRSVANLEIDTGTYFGYLLYGKCSRWIIAYSNTPFE